MAERDHFTNQADGDALDAKNKQQNAKIQKRPSAYGFSGRPKECEIKADKHT